MRRAHCQYSHFALIIINILYYFSLRCKYLQSKTWLQCRTQSWRRCDQKKWRSGCFPRDLRASSVSVQLRTTIHWTARSISKLSLVLATLTYGSVSVVNEKTEEIWRNWWVANTLARTYNTAELSCYLQHFKDLQVYSIFLIFIHYKFHNSCTKLLLIWYHLGYCIFSN